MVVAVVETTAEVVETMAEVEVRVVDHMDAAMAAVTVDIMVVVKNVVPHNKKLKSSQSLQ